MTRWERVEQLYHAALELDPESRKAFLARACAEDESLYEEVSRLVFYEGRLGGFIETPALEIAAKALAGDSQPASPAKPSTASPVTRIGPYQILGLLGKGGMGEVYLALDDRLKRRVAIKFLPAELTGDAESLRRFAGEARAASALNHPNIITIYDIGDLGSTHYIITEYVEGETLRRRCDRGQIEPEEAIGLAVQVAEALQAAHGAGIIHRDIKLENVMVRPDGYVKVLDFGLAKLLEPTMAADFPSVLSMQTQTGLVIGTPLSMSPEQARGEKADARTDIFSLGVMLYEMTTGQAPFKGSTQNDVIAAILKDEPPPVSNYLPDSPGGLERIIRKALQKDREQRYQTVGDLLRDLNELKQTMTLAAPPQGAGLKSVASLLSVRHWRFAFFTLIALAALSLAVGGAWFYFGGPPVLTSQDTILLADFDNRTGDEIFDLILKQGLAVQLQQSPFLNLLPEARARQLLPLMNRPADARITPEIGREICERLSLKALITGSISPLGSHYAITLEALNGQSGETLAREQTQAESKEQVLRALGQGATRLREKLGESLSTIQRFDTPLEQATTSSLEAFKAWSVGIEHSYAGRVMEAITFYRRAVEIDPEFAHAYSVLSVVYWATGRPELAAEYAEKGYALRNRVSEYEKLRIENFYHGFVTGNLEQRIEIVALHRQLYPHEGQGLTDLALTYNLMGKHDQALQEARQAVLINSTFAPAHWALGAALLRLDRFAEARDGLTEALQQVVGNLNFRTLLYHIAFIEGDETGMQEQIEWARGRPDEYVALDWQAGAAAFKGQWRRAQEFSRQAIESSDREDTREVSVRYAKDQELRGAVLGDCRWAESGVGQELKSPGGRASLPRAALALALCGELSQAELLAAELAGRYPEDTIINSNWLPAIRAAIHLQGGLPGAQQAIAELQPPSSYEGAGEFWPQYLRGLAWLKLGRGQEAAAEFQRILDHRGQAPLSVLYPLAKLGVARASALDSDAAKSREAFEDFFAAWKAADPDLPVLMQARKDFEGLPAPVLP